MHAHRETAALFERLVPASAVPQRMYYRCSRWRSGSAPNPLEDLTAIIGAIDAEAAAELLCYLDDVYEAEHGGDVLPFERAMLAEAEADAAEDAIQVRAGMDRAALRELIARNRRQEVAGRMLRRAAQQELARRSSGGRPVRKVRRVSA